MLNLTISIIVFFTAAWFLNRYLDEQGIPNGITRGVMVLVFATLMSWVVGWAVDWSRFKDESPQVSVQAPGGVSQILKDANQVNQ